jgi:hypothetical protein
MKNLYNTPGPINGNEDGMFHGSSSYQYTVDGDVYKTFEDEWAAEQCFDEDKANCQAIANDAGLPVIQRIVADGETIRQLVIQPARVTREKFVRTDREQLHKLETTLAFIKGGLEGNIIMTTDADTRKSLRALLATLEKTNEKL